MDIKSYIKTRVLSIFLITIIIGCETTKQKEASPMTPLSLYQKDSLKYGKEVADFIFEFDSLFYFDSLGNMFAKRKVDSFLNINQHNLRKVTYPYIVLDSQKISEFTLCARCDIKFALLYKNFDYMDTTRQLQFWYKDSFGNESQFFYYQIDYRTPIPIGLSEAEANRAIEKMEKEEQIRKEKQIINRQSSDGHKDK